MPRPNILVIMPDDHQFDAFGVAGHPDVKTPNLDTLARKGTRFSQANNIGSLTAPVCSPARACLLTGQHPFRSNTNPRPSGSAGDSVTIPPNLPTSPQLFGKCGYETFFTGKWHNDPETLLRSFSLGENIFLGGMCHHDAVPVMSRYQIEQGLQPTTSNKFSTEIFCDSLIDFLSTRDQETPFFAWMSLTSPHDPRTPPDKFRQMYDDENLSLPDAFAPEPAFDNGELEVRDETLAPKPLTAKVTQKHLADYYGMISHHDDQLGRVWQALEDTGVEENTIIVYVGDHGLALGRHGLLGKQNLYEHSLRVPLIIAGPGIAKNEVSQSLVYSMDIFATLLELAGISIPPDITSISLLPQLKAPKRIARKELFGLYKDCQRTIRNEQWKLIEYQVNGESSIELFDLQKDPHELNNLSADPQNKQIILSLRRRLASWQDRLGDEFMPIDTDTIPPSSNEYRSL
ncbi:sulfatase-like hydrolase/transferase [Puniceicoccaceae bacterium K14]|nr:sulfatase-like hydrolase/transferase [Puniceicoccaceae bacterium K14]